MPLTYKEQLDALTDAYNLIAKANEIIMQSQMGTFSYDEHEGHKRSYSYGISDVREKVVAAMNSINQAANSITDYVQQKDREDGR